MLIRTKFLLLLCVIFNHWHSFAQNISEQNNSNYIQFIENKGQWEPNVLYKAQLLNGYFFIENDGLTFKLFDPKVWNQLHEHHHDNKKYETSILNGISFKFLFGKNCSSTKPIYKQNGIYNYFLGKDSSRWASGVNAFNQIILFDIFEGIHLKIYSKGVDIKFDWIITHPKFLSNLKIKIEGTDFEQINQQLAINTPFGKLIDDKPVSFQANQEIETDYISKKNEYSFKLKNYNSNDTIIIDPKLIFSTYSGSRGDNFGFTATYDQRSNLYAGGITSNQFGEYPVTLGAFSRTFSGGVGNNPVNLACDITISKYDSTGSKLLYATYLGGSNDEYPHSMVVDEDSNLCVLGTTYSDNFPTTSNCFDNSFNNPGVVSTDIVVFKLSKHGDKLLGSTYLGGNKSDGLNQSSLKYFYADDFRGEIQTDKNNRIFIATTTYSNNFPLAKQLKNTIGGNQDAVIACFNSKLSNLLWSTYYGGSNDDAAFSLDFTKNGLLYVGGASNSFNLPNTSNTLNQLPQGDVDGYLALFDTLTFKNTKSTYYGTEVDDIIYFTEVDNMGKLYAFGITHGNIAASKNVYCNKTNTKQFLFNIDENLKSNLIQTTFGNQGSPDISPSAFMVDSCSNIYISGWGSNLNEKPTTNLPITNNAIQNTTDGNDFYIAVFGKNMSSLLFATYFGGNKSDDHVDGGTSRFDKRGVVYQSVCASCHNYDGTFLSDFPISKDAVFKSNLSPRCSNASFKIDLQISSFVKSKFLPDTIFCSKGQVQFKNLSNGKTFFWDFGDGNTSTDFEPLHSYSQLGDYNVKLTVIDSNSCNVSSESTNFLKVISAPKSEFEYKQEDCRIDIEFLNKSENYDKFIWDFGNGAKDSMQANPTHEFKEGSYKVKLITIKNKICYDTSEIELTISGDKKDSLEFYNVFTPGNDLKNECFFIGGDLNNCTNLELKIFNRWGEKVYESKDFNSCWDGTYRKTQKACPDGVYFYLVKLENEKTKKIKTISGTVTIIRKN